MVPENFRSDAATCQWTSRSQLLQVSDSTSPSQSQDRSVLALTTSRTRISRMLRFLETGLAQRRPYPAAAPGIVSFDYLDQGGENNYSGFARDIDERSANGLPFLTKYR